MSGGARAAPLDLRIERAHVCLGERCCPVGIAVAKGVEDATVLLVGDLEAKAVVVGRVGIEPTTRGL